MAHWFYVPPENIDLKKSSAVLAGEEWKHAARVIRLKPDDELELFDGQGNVYRSIISAVKNKSFLLKITQSSYRERDYNLAVFVGHPKGSKVDLIIKALTEAGATSIGLFTGIYSEGKAKSAQKLERLRKISLEACKQSQRAWLPAIEVNLDFEDLLSRMQKTKSVVFYEKAIKYQPLSSFKSRDIAVIIGPEGGFDRGEVDLLEAKGAILSRLSDSVLRVETAAIAATSLVRYAQLGT